MRCDTPHKVKYANKFDAESALLMIWRSKVRHSKTDKISIIPTGSYQCRCKQWHLTSKQDNRSDVVKAECDYYLTIMPKGRRKSILKQLKNLHEKNSPKEEDSTQVEDTASSEDTDEAVSEEESKEGSQQATYCSPHAKEV